MPRELDAVRRVDLGAGVYAHVPEPGPDRPGRAPARQSPGSSRRVPPAAFAAGTAFACGALLRLGVNPHGLLVAGLLAVLTALAAVDVRARVLPNHIVGPALLAVLAWQLAFFGDRWAEWLIAGLGAGALLLAPSLVHRGAVGMGDVKLAVLLGVALGSDVVPALTIGCLAALPVALYLLARGGRGASIAYGPFLAVGAAVVLLV